MERESLGTLLAITGMFIYGLEPVVIKSNPSNPISFAAFSALTASLILWGSLFLSGDWREILDNPGDLRKAFFVGLFGTALAYLAYSFGARMSTAINAALITRSEVLFSFFLSWLFLGERITRRLVGYSLFILAGLTFVITQGRSLELHLGDFLLLLVPLFWQLGHVIAKRLSYGPIIIAALRNTFGFLLLFPLAAATSLELSRFVIAEGMIIALGQIVWYKSIKLINLSKATAIITPAPAVAIGIGVLLGESFTLYHAIGFLLITLGTLGAVKVKSELRT
ncbi:DMT family transporter [Thermococcus sp. GR7]|uniref:DMT family transporter n=1 Tax=unclassified Thermococcus TaxID=2627626 RepID=UPI00142F46F6|nr:MULTISPECIES: DMT family transporter [unclassified Thermococcus]NJE47262.1 DMT family transporter [Thermococcus sp. GR7]NJE78627.1 DMT family transporter [Thermococcus sp. GR4]NJF23248.1 DMT family transporter [Thermococcus sp. GR5]